MKTWNYKNDCVNDEYLQTAWNNTLTSKLNEINESVLNENDEISASYVLRNLLESLDWSNKPIINYRYDNEHSIFVNNTKLCIENYEYNHQKDEEWIESAKNIFLNLETTPTYITYPEICKNKDTFRNYLNEKYTSGKVVNNNDVIYSALLDNTFTNTFNLIFFHIDELKSNDAIYEYSEKNNENLSLLPYLMLIDNNIK